MNSNQYQQLTCKLREHVITSEGDFIPAGTPVHVAGWAGDGEKITVRTTAYMWADEFSGDDIEAARDGGSVGSGLWIDVPPGNLVYSEMRVCTKIGMQCSR